MNSVSVARECCKAGARDPMCKVYLQRRIMQQPLVFRVFFSIFSFFHRNMSHSISGSAGISHSLPLNSLKLSIIVRSIFRGRGIGANTPDWEFQRSWMESPPEMALKFTAMLPNCENVSRRVCAGFSSLGNVLKHRRLFTASLTRTYIYHKGFIHSREGLWARAAD